MASSTPDIKKTGITIGTVLEDEIIWGEQELEKNKDDDTSLYPILADYAFDESSFAGLSTETKILEEPQSSQYLDSNLSTNKKEADPLFVEMKKVLEDHHILSEKDLLLQDIIKVIRKNTNYYEIPKDSILKEIDTSTSISYWKRECPKLFDYPDKMHGFKTSWEFLKGVYDPKKHKQLYYNDLKEINHKLYRAVYRRNSKEKFLPSHNDRIAEEIKAMKEKKIELADIKNPKLKERFRMRFHSEK